VEALIVQTTKVPALDHKVKPAGVVVPKPVTAVGPPEKPVPGAIDPKEKLAVHVGTETGDGESGVAGIYGDSIQPS